MNKKAEFWMMHVAAIKREGISTVTYAKRHTLAVKSLYRWQRKLNSATEVTAKVNDGGAFVALRVAEPIVGHTLSGCTLMLGSGMRLEMATLPAPEWLAAFGHATQGVR